MLTEKRGKKVAPSGVLKPRPSVSMQLTVILAYRILYKAEIIHKGGHTLTIYNTFNNFDKPFAYFVNLHGSKPLNVRCP
jgi:hypothetical protein